MFAQNLTMTGLNSYSVSVPTAGPYFVKGKISLPTISNGGGQSLCVATITNRTGPTTVYTGLPGAEGFYVDTPCAANDVLTITFSSSAPADQPPNVIKAVVSVGSGQ